MAEENGEAGRKSGSVELSDSQKHKLFHKYVWPNRDLIYKICIEQTKNGSNVDDNYQECLINFYKYIHTYNEDQKALTWVHVVARRCVQEIERRRARLAVDCVEPENVANKFFIDEGGGSQNEEVTTENCKELLSDEVIKALDDLNPIYRDTFLKKLSGYKLKEIMHDSYDNGSLKTKNIETVKSRLFLSRQHLRKALRGYYEKR